MCSLHGRAIIFEPVDSWIIVRVFRTMLALSEVFEYRSVRILSNIIMLWRSDGEMIRVVASLCEYAKCIALVAIVVVFPVCLPMQATMRLDGSFRSCS